MVPMSTIRLLGAGAFASTREGWIVAPKVVGVDGLGVQVPEGPGADMIGEGRDVGSQDKSVVRFFSSSGLCPEAPSLPMSFSNGRKPRILLSTSLGSEVAI